MIYAKYEFSTNNGSKCYTMHESGPSDPKTYIGFVIVHPDGNRVTLDEKGYRVGDGAKIIEWKEAVNVHEIRARCSDHDDSYGCCDRCGIWANQLNMSQEALTAAYNAYMEIPDESTTKHVDQPYYDELDTDFSEEDEPGCLCQICLGGEDCRYMD